MTVTVRPTGPELYRWFRVRVAKDGEHETVIRLEGNGVRLLPGVNHRAGRLLAVVDEDLQTIAGCWT